MSTSKTIGTIFATIAVGAIAFLFSAPKKVTKKKETKDLSATEKKNYDRDNLFV